MSKDSKFSEKTASYLQKIKRSPYTRIFLYILTLVVVPANVLIKAWQNKETYLQIVNALNPINHMEQILWYGCYAFVLFTLYQLAVAKDAQKERTEALETASREREEKYTKEQAEREAKEAKYREDTENYLYYLACAVKAHTIIIGNYKQIHPLVGDLREGGMSKDEYHTYMNGKAPYPPFPAWEKNID
jgi:Ca2+/Na+ antiporter